MSVEDSNTEAEFNNYLDRCDRCNAQGQKKVVLGDLMLVFCNHHYNKNASSLEDGGWQVLSRKEESKEQEPVTVG